MPSEPAPGRGVWWIDPLSWAELFALSNIAFLAVDIGLAHSVNEFANPAEYIPVAFSLIAPVVLIAIMVIDGFRPALAGNRLRRRRLARGVGLAVGWTSVVIGIAGVLFHLDSAFFAEQTLKNLVYTAPFAAPLAYTGIGLLLILNRMIDSQDIDWARWVVLLAGAGFVGNFVLTLADHAQNGFFHPTEWVGVVASAWAVSVLLAVLVVPDNRPLLGLALIIMAAQVVVGLLGAYLHLAAVMDSPAPTLWDRVLYGAPVFAPLLFADLALLAVLAFWGILQARGRVAPSGSGSVS